MSRAGVPLRALVELLTELASRYPQVVDLQATLDEATALVTRSSDRGSALVHLLEELAGAPALLPADRKRLLTRAGFLLRDALAFERTCLDILDSRERKS